MVYKYDFLIIGAGVAGMSYALKVARAKKGSVCIICKTNLDCGKDAWVIIYHEYCSVIIHVAKLVIVC